jgi:hypothetical protein
MEYNTRNYSWSECEINVAGQMQIEVTAVEWNEEQEKEFLYAKGSDPIAIKRGNINRTGTLTLLQGGLAELQDISPNGSLIALKGIDIQIAFFNDESGAVESYSLGNAEFTGAPMRIAQNDKKMEVAIPFMYLTQRRN